MPTESRKFGTFIAKLAAGYSAGVFSLKDPQAGNGKIRYISIFSPANLSDQPHALGFAQPQMPVELPELELDLAAARIKKMGLDFESLIEPSDSSSPLPPDGDDASVDPDARFSDKDLKELDQPQE